MDKRKRLYVGVSAVLTLAFAVLGATIFQRSFIRLWETFANLVSSCQFYFYKFLE